MNFENENIKDRIIISPALLDFATKISQYTIPFSQFNNYIEILRPVFEKCSYLASIYEATDKLAKNQFVLIKPIPQDLIDYVRINDIDTLELKYLISEELVQETISFCGILGNRLFTQSVKALKESSFDLAILGLTAVLDRVLSLYSGQIKNVNIKSRYKAIKERVENKGDLFIDDLESRDFVLFLTYPKAMELFGTNSDFTGQEPKLLNRHWIMHGRSEKEYSKLDCVKVLNMIYGTIRMGQLGKENQKVLIV